MSHRPKLVSDVSKRYLHLEAVLKRSVSMPGGLRQTHMHALRKMNSQRPPLLTCQTGQFWLMITPLATAGTVSDRSDNEVPPPPEGGSVVCAKVRE